MLWNYIKLENKKKNIKNCKLTQLYIYILCWDEGYECVYEYDVLCRC